MDIRILQYYLVVAKENNVTKAANILHVTQPTLSRQLKQLEEELGVRLFIRHNHHIELSEEGRLLKRRAEELTTLAEKTKQELSNDTTSLEGCITIGSGEYMSTDLLVKRMQEFHQLYPGVTFEMSSGNAIENCERVKEGLLDFALVSDYTDLSSFETCYMPKKEEWGIYVQEDHPLAKKKTVTATTLRKYPLLLTEGAKRGNFLSTWFNTPMDELNIVATYTLFYNASLLVKNKMGIAVGIRLNQFSDGLCFIPFSPALTNRTAVICKETFIRNRETQEFLTYLKKCKK